ILMLVAFKYTSNQRGIKAARDDIKAHMLALKLYKDNAAVTVQALGRILLGAGRLLVLAVVPMLVMAVPMTMLLAQLALWYQARPLHIGEEAVMTIKLAGTGSSAWPEVSLVPSDALAVTIGPLHVQSKRELCWNIKAGAAGLHRVVFHVDGQQVDKELAIGDGFMRVSTERPGWSWSAALLNPREQPFGPESPVQSIEIDYPKRPSWVSGSDTWVIYWFLMSMVAAFCCRGILGVNL
ncbi:MAG TPA: hypothetical protein VNX28_14855, partial [Gemmataceae bacterium]|nr:hypothetical protein [Gemmataceae bacterium]